MEIRGCREDFQDVKILGRVHDVSKYFRILALAKVDRWKTSIILAGQLVDETRVTMGHLPSPQTAQRLSFLIGRYLLQAFDVEFPKILEGMSRLTQDIVSVWVEWTRQAVRSIQNHIRPFLVQILQDGFTIPTITEEVATWLEVWVVKKLAEELGIKLSQKKLANQPFAEVFSAIGATFDTRVGQTKVSPNKPVIDKLRLMLVEWPRRKGWRRVWRNGSDGNLTIGVRRV